MTTTPVRHVSREVARRFLVLRHLLAPPRSLPAEPACSGSSTGSARSSSTRSRSPAATTTWCCSRASPATAASGRTTGCTGPAAVRDLQQEPRIVPDAELPRYRISGTGTASRTTARRSTSTRRSSRSCSSGSATQRRAAVARRRAARGDRLVLAPHEPGPGDPRGPRRGRHHRHQPARGQPPRLRPRRAAVPGGAPRAPPGRGGAAAPPAAGPLPGQRPARRAGEQELWVGHRQGAAAAPTGRPARRRPASSSRSRSRGSRASASSSRRSCRSWTQPRRGRAEVADGWRIAGPAARSPASRSSRRSIRCAGTATCCAGCSASTTSGRSTSRRRSGAGATTSCRSCTATASSGGSSRGIERPAGTLRVLGLWWEPGFDPLDDANPGFVDAFAAALRAHLAFSGLHKVAMPRTAAHRALAAATRDRLAPVARAGGRAAAAP